MICSLFLWSGRLECGASAGQTDLFIGHTFVGHALNLAFGSSHMLLIKACVIYQSLLVALLQAHGSPRCDLLRPLCRHTRVELSPQCSKKSRRKKKYQQQPQQPQHQQQQPLQQQPLQQGRPSMQASRQKAASDAMQVCDDSGCRLLDSSAHMATSALHALSLDVTPNGNRLIPTPGAYQQLLERALPEEVTIVRYGAPWCRSCRTIGPSLQEFVGARYPTGLVYELSLVRNGKAAGERMYRHYKARGCSSMPFFEVFKGSQLLEALDAKCLDLQSGDRP